MIIFKEPDALGKFVQEKKQQGHLVGFVPTMGALHAGHLALIQAAKNNSNLVVCSLFVNPAQFNDPKDFEKYPKTTEQDVYLLEKEGCDVLFMPAVETMYPSGLKPRHHYDLGRLESLLEGKYRPGHFQGVCQVMHRLLEIVQTDKLFIGQKDFQQCMVIKRLTEILKIPVTIIICATLREKDGLAMSSRNVRLSPADREKAPAIYAALTYINEHIADAGIEELIMTATDMLTEKGFRVDYVTIADRDTLEPANGDTKQLVALAAAYLGEVRLIDNLILTNK